VAVVALGHQGPGVIVGVIVTFVILHLLEAAVLTPKLNRIT